MAVNPQQTNLLRSEERTSSLRFNCNVSIRAFERRSRCFVVPKL